MRLIALWSGVGIGLVAFGEEGAWTGSWVEESVHGSFSSGRSIARWYRHIRRHGKGSEISNIHGWRGDVIEGAIGWVVVMVCSAGAVMLILVTGVGCHRGLILGVS